MKTIIIILGFTISNILCDAQEAEQTFSLPQGKVNANYVCMVDNAYKDSLQTSIALDGKIYYGCCNPCIEYLQADKTIRYATDPLTGKEVDKANAFIVIKADGTANVMCFKSEENYNQYLKQ